MCLLHSISNCGKILLDDRNNGTELHSRTPSSAPPKLHQWKSTTQLQWESASCVAAGLCDMLCPATALDYNPATDKATALGSGPGASYCRTGLSNRVEIRGSANLQPIPFKDPILVTGRWPMNELPRHTGLLGKLRHIFLFFSAKMCHDFPDDPTEGSQM